MSEADVEVTSLDLKAILQTARVPDPLTNLLDGAYESIEDHTPFQHRGTRPLASEAVGRGPSTAREFGRGIHPLQPTCRTSPHGTSGRAHASGRHATVQDGGARPGGDAHSSTGELDGARPPKLTQDKIDALIDRFNKNHPAKILTQDTTPSIRLLSLVHEGLKSRLGWIPWQYRLSQCQAVPGDP